LNSSRGWFCFQAVRYYIRSKFWQAIYKKLGITMLWTMFDVDPEKLIKTQALELVNGLYLGSHWSNFPKYRIDNQKCYDVLFTWGKHFISSNFSNYPYMAAFITGYPSDHYFLTRMTLADEMKRSLKDKFVISFQDNMIASDILYSKGMQVAVHRMLIDMLLNDNRLILLLKPKRKYIFEQILAELPELQSLIDADRVKVFLGETVRSKAVPAEIGKASDLVIGLGISTTAAECCFAGTVSFHADLTGFKDNAFGNAGLNKVVFRDINSLRSAIQSQINGQGITIEECRKYHKMLDPFQDGQAYKRTGAIIGALQKELASGLSRLDAVKKVQQRYNKFSAVKEEVLV
ncbi:MAG: hypothetical protein KJ732_04275, partial [Candidatus Margulisbacteria bacterium]|nr:hypothetical protein [Candidatus Margulisiibacteriota bacterium]